MCHSTLCTKNRVNSNPGCGLLDAHVFPLPLLIIMPSTMYGIRLLFPVLFYGFSIFKMLEIELHFLFLLEGCSSFKPISVTLW